MSLSFSHLNLPAENNLNSSELILRAPTEILSVKNKHKYKMNTNILVRIYTKSLINIYREFPVAVKNNNIHMKCLIKSQYYRILAK